MIIFYYGKETFGQEERIALLKEKFFAKNASGGGLLIFDCSEDITLSAIQTSFGAQNLFAEKKLIIVQDFFQHFDSESQKLLKDALSCVEGDVVVFVERSVPRKNATLFTWLLKNADTSEEFDFPDMRTSGEYIVRQFEKNDCLISPKNAQYLAEICGDDLYRRKQEIDKLRLYASGREITISDIELLCPQAVQGNMFAAIESLTRGRSAETMKLLHRQVRSGDDVHYIFSMYVYQIRTLLSVGGFYYDNGVSDKNVIAKALKLHPFVVEKSLGVVRLLSKKRLRQAHKSLLLIDQDVKIGKREMRSALEMFIMDF